MKDLKISFEHKKVQSIVYQMKEISLLKEWEK